MRSTDRSTLRLIDANANRAREALRVLEDGARFLRDDATVSAGLKTLRHDLRKAIGAIASDDALLAARDAAGDVGTRITTEAEGVRVDEGAVLRAAGKRLSEALRSLEEWGKTIDPAIGAAFERLRYRAYDLERRLLAGGGAPQWRLCLLLTRGLCLRPWTEVLTEAIAGGVDCVQVREKDDGDAALLAHADEVVDRARSASVEHAPVAVVINDRIDVALSCGADGVHLGTGDLPIERARPIAGRRLWIGASTHDEDEARRAIDAGADVCGVGAMFATELKPERSASGPALLARYLARFDGVPHLAIGGVTVDRVAALRAVGARGVAVSRAICAAHDPRATARAFRAALERGDGDPGARELLGDREGVREA